MPIFIIILISGIFLALHEYFTHKKDEKKLGLLIKISKYLLVTVVVIIVLIGVFAVYYFWQMWQSCFGSWEECSGFYLYE